LGVAETSVMAAIVSDFVNRIKEFERRFREGCMEVILGLRYRVR
jgi:hypothetical protein